MTGFGTTAGTAAWADVIALDAEAARELALRGEAVLVDIRTPEEWQLTGLPDMAVPLNMMQPDFLPRVKALWERTGNKPLMFICASGVRSDHVARSLHDRGLDAVADVSEGMKGNGIAPGWLARGLPLRRPGEAPNPALPAEWLDE